MTEENTLAAEPAQAIPADNKWVEDISSSQSVHTTPKRRLEAEIRYHREVDPIVKTTE